MKHIRLILWCVVLVYGLATLQASDDANSVLNIQGAWIARQVESNYHGPIPTANCKTTIDPQIRHDRWDLVVDIRDF
jgi:hypothetical protein